MFSVTMTPGVHGGALNIGPFKALLRFALSRIPNHIIISTKNNGASNIIKRVRLKFSVGGEKKPVTVSHRSADQPCVILETTFKSLWSISWSSC